MSKHLTKAAPRVPWPVWAWLIVATWWLCLLSGAVWRGGQFQ
jgi:hypothetical protein